MLILLMSACGGPPTDDEATAALNELVFREYTQNVASGTHLCDAGCGNCDGEKHRAAHALLGLTTEVCKGRILTIELTPLGVEKLWEAAFVHASREVTAVDEILPSPAGYAVTFQHAVLPTELGAALASKIVTSDAPFLCDTANGVVAASESGEACHGAGGVSELEIAFSNGRWSTPVEHHGTWGIR